MKGHAVLDDAGLHRLDGQRWTCEPVEDIRHAGDVLQLALDKRLARIWLVPGSMLSESLAQDERWSDDFIECARQNGWDLWTNNDKDFLSGWKKGTAQVQLGIPERSTRWEAMAACRNAATLYGAIKYLQDLLSVEISWAPGHVGFDLIKQCNQDRRASYIRLSESDLSIFFRYAQQYHHNDLLWSRPLSQAERSMTWLHRFDKNAAYVGAASSVVCGAGEYEYRNRPELDPKLPGVWHILLSGESPFDGRDLPHPTSGALDSWQHTPVVKLCADLGYQVSILESVTFPEYHQTLRPVYDVISTARTRLMSPGAFKNASAQAIALSSLKKIYAAALGGKLAELARAEKQDQLYRPDWWAAIKALTRARMFYRIRDLAPAHTPVAVHTDALYFVSNDPNPRAAIPGLLSDDETALGKFKVVDSFYLADVGLDVFARLGRLEKRLAELGALEVEDDG